MKSLLIFTLFTFGFNAFSETENVVKLFVNTTDPLSASDVVKAQVKAVKLLAQCRDGNKRLTNDATFFVNSDGKNSSMISGDFQEGILPGENSNLYIGKSAWNDLMFVTQVNDGNKIIGYNVTLSFCEVPNAFVNLPKLISDKTRLANFTATSGIFLGKSFSCDHGTVDAAFNTSITALPDQNEKDSANFTAPTSFTKPNGCIQISNEKVSIGVVDDARGAAKPISYESTAHENASSAVSK